MPHAAVWPALALACGIALGVWSGIDARVFACVLAPVTAAATVCLFFRRPRFLQGLLLIGWTVAGAALGSHADMAAHRPPLVAAVEALEASGPLTITGHLREESEGNMSTLPRRSPRRWAPSP